MRDSMANRRQYLTSFEPGFYFDGETIYVDIGEFINAYGMDDMPELYDVIWSESQKVFSGIPIKQLPPDVRFTTKEKASARLRTAFGSPQFWQLIEKNNSDA